MALEYRFDHQGNVELQNSRKHSYCWWYFLGFILLQVAVLVWLYFSGYLTPATAEGAGAGQALSLRGKVNEQERLLQNQAQVITRLESQFISARRSEKIQQVANTSLREQLAAAEADLAESRERLLLYEEILSPSSAKRGLNVLHLGIKRLQLDADGKKLPHNRYYQYHLILTNINGGNEASVVEGSFNLQVVGKLHADDPGDKGDNGDKAGRQVTLDLQTIRATTSAELPATTTYSFSLKYYQSLEGSIELPAGFAPQTVIVELRPTGKQAGKKVIRQYDWNSFKLSASTAKPR